MKTLNPSHRFGIAVTSGSLAVLAFVGKGWLVFVLLPIFPLGNIANPAVQTLASRLVGPGEQGRLQGTLASVTSSASVFGPLAFATLYSTVEQSWPGAVRLGVALLFAASAPLAGRIGVATRSSEWQKSDASYRALGAAIDPDRRLILFLCLPVGGRCSASH